MRAELRTVAADEVALAQEEDDAWSRFNALWLDLQVRSAAYEARELLFGRWPRAGEVVPAM